jgi:hypothetical protein
VKDGWYVIVEDGEYAANLGAPKAEGRCDGSGG